MFGFTYDANTIIKFFKHDGPGKSARKNMEIK
jgi:hypothetical protein